MEKNVEFEGDHLTRGPNFYQLPFGDDDVGLGMESMDQTLRYSSIFSFEETPKILCFGNDNTEGEELLLPETNGTPQKSVISSCLNSLSDSEKKRKGTEQQPDQCMETISIATVGSQRPPKKTKSENTASKSRPKRKEKLGERIATLQQLVSPFGKTDTASVLHEAMGYIRFLHDQVQLLCSPFLLPSSPQLGDGDNKAETGETIKKDLRSRGLCLIPVESTLHVANDNGADFWSPARGVNNVS